jgi:hypothetical protein
MLSDNSFATAPGEMARGCFSQTAIGSGYDNHFVLDALRHSSSFVSISSLPLAAGHLLQLFGVARPLHRDL